MFPSKSHRGWLPSAPWLATATGILAFGLLRSFKLISPSRVAWLFQFDAAQSYFGWLFYRHEPWTFPLGVVHRLGMEQSSSIVYTDSIPLLAVVFKVFSAALPPGFQYLGLWLCSCYALQGYFAFRLISLFTRDRIALAVGTLLFLLSPVLLVRAQIHFGLTAQWIVVCALYLYYLPAERSRLRQWLLLLWLAPLIHAYLMFMAFVIWGAYLVRHMLSDRGRSALRLVGWGLASVLGSLAVMWLVGYFVGDMDVSTWGFGFFSMNLLAPFAPNDIGPFLMPAFRTATFGQSDGFNYLGLGVLFGLLVVVGSQLSARRHAASEGCLPWLRKPDSALILCCIVLWLFALSNHITLGSNVIVKWPLSSGLDRYANIFRSSGRLFLAGLLRIVDADCARPCRIAGTKSTRISTDCFSSFRSLISSRIFSKFMQVRCVWRNPRTYLLSIPRSGCKPARVTRIFTSYRVSTV